ncbi:PAS domain S-box [Bernardetia litoralis DSM 6794]|uniref:histidine kinase n=1 Tax=Bernardetia litoralis (strain ATCC 23117 / DSM 6794 / NBRC 15988 / NCIMB 1366 / Fx l1 / Sio-4) TaxID=880071 RepID=I4AGA1_BERLS|nr:PAS domain S-box protein [Bernardetia litoralis]AFM02986.1 PAS domain S-box [Bernardetia litoralis DSM 6794]
MPHTNPLFELSTEALCILDTQNCILHANTAMEEFTQQKKQALVGNDFLKEIEKKFECQNTITTKNLLAKFIYQLEKTRKQINIKIIDSYTFTLHKNNINSRKEYKISAISTQNQQIYISIVHTSDNLASNLADTFIETSAIQTKQLNIILATVPDGIFIINEKGIISLVNPAAEIIFGYKEEELLGKSIEILLADKPIPDTLAQLIIDSSSDLKTINNVELITKHKNQNEFPISVSLSETHFEDGKTVYIALVRNLTKSKEEKNKLRDSQNFGESIFQAAKIGLAVINQWGYFVNVNKQYALMTGYEPEELIGKVYSIIAPNFELEDAINTIKHTRTENTTIKRFWKLLRKDNSLIDIELYINDFYNRHEEQFFILSSKDITDEKNIEKDLRNTKNLLEGIFQSLDNVFWSYDIKKDKLLTISAAIEKIYDISQEELKNDPNAWLKKVHPEDLKLIIEVRKKAREGQSMSYEYRIIDAKGNIKWIQTDVKVTVDKNKIPIRIEGVDTEITQRVLANQELDSTKRMLQFILDSLPDGVIFTSPNLEIEWINPAIKNLLGYEEEEYIGKVFSSLFEENSFSLVADHFNIIDKTSIFEIILRGKNGNLIYSETISTPVYDSNKIIIGYLYVIRDISERKMFEEEKAQIMRSLAQFKRTLDVTKDSVFMFDATTHLFIYANKGATEAVGYSFEELRNMKLIDLMNDINPQDFEQLTSYVINNTNHQINIDTYFLHKSEGKFPVNLLLQYVDLDDGENRFVAIVRDISDRKTSEKLLKESELKFRSTFEQAGIGIAHIEIDLSWATFNVHFCKITGYSQDELSIRKLREITHPKDLPRDIMQLRRVLNEKSEGYSMRTRYIHKNGDTIWLNLSLSVVKDDDKKPAFIVMFIENISDQVEAEEMLRQTLEELKVSNYELDQFVYKASHDLRSPLTSILGLLNIAEIDREHALSHVKQIRGRIHKLDEFVQSIINYSQTSNLETKYEPLHIEYLIHTNIADLDFLPYSNEIKFKIKSNQKGVIYTDNLRLNVILRNLLSNAIKFADKTKKTSIILIETKLRKDKKFVLTITDNGLGIDTAYQERIFDMFYRGNEKSDGNGLGLYIVRQAVEKLGGELKFASELGKGSTFMIILPNFKPQTEKKLKKLFIPPNLNNKKGNRNN